MSGQQEYKESIPLKGVLGPVDLASSVSVELYEKIVAERDRCRNSLAERAEECENLRQSNQRLASQLQQECLSMYDTKRLDWLEGKKDNFLHNVGESLRGFIDEAMLQEQEREEEKRQDRISELRTELAKLTVGGEEQA